MKNLRAARIDQLADSNEPAIIKYVESLICISQILLLITIELGLHKVELLPNLKSPFNMAYGLMKGRYIILLRLFEQPLGVKGLASEQRQVAHVTFIFTVRNVVVRKVMFYTCLSVILFTGGDRGKGGSGRHLPGQTPPRHTPPGHTPLRQIPPGQTPPRQTAPRQTPLSDTPWAHTPQADTPPGRHPPGQTPPRADTSRADGYCSGWYASYWNAFLFIIVSTDSRLK